MVLRKTPQQIAHMRRAGAVVAEMHEACTRAAKPGATTADLDAAAREVLDRRHARSNFLGYHGFPAVACISPNEVIVHGIPGDRRLGRRRHRVDRLRRHHRGLARRRRDHGAGRRDRRRGPAPDRRHRAPRSRPRSRSRSTATGSATSAPPSRRSRSDAGFSVVREYVGHGIGTAMHEEPDVPNYGPAGRGLRLREGMVLAIEPMVTRGPGDHAASATTAGRSSPPTAPAPRTSSTPSRSRERGPEVLTLPWL